MTQLVRSDSLTGYCEVVEGLGGRPEELLSLFDLTTNQICSGSFLLPYRTFVDLLERTANTLGCPDFGIRCAQQQDFSVLGPIALAAQQGENLGQALQSVSSYLHVYTPALGLNVSIMPGGKTLLVALEILLKPYPQCAQAVELTMALTAKIIRMLSGGQSNPLRVLMTHSQINTPSIYRNAFPCEVLFNQSVSGYEVLVGDLNLPLLSEQSELGEVACRYLESHFSAKQQTMSERVRALIKPLLMVDQCSNTVIAKTLGVEVRQLHRLLEIEGGSFRGIKDSVLKELAELYLREETLKLGQVAILLGYSEQSGFSRSCQRWFSMGPREYRKSVARVT